MMHINFKMLCTGSTRGSLCVVCRFVEFEAYLSVCDSGVWNLSAAELLFYETQKYVAWLLATAYYV